MKIVFILVNPAVPENIGFSLRAIKTMGFSEMRIVGTFDKEGSAVRKTAYGSHDILEKVSVFGSLKDSLSDIDLAIGTSSKSRTLRKDVIESKDINTFIATKENSIGSLAIVFGSEENGLSNNEMSQCHVISTVPMSVTYPSLNLAQSVMVYAYELAGLTLEQDTKEEESLFPTLWEESADILKWLELDSNPVLYQRIRDRLSLAPATDINLLLSVLKKLKRKKEGS